MVTGRVTLEQCGCGRTASTAQMLGGRCPRCRGGRIPSAAQKAAELARPKLRRGEGGCARQAK
ncbi:MAG: hypothetical protein A3J48_02620 [Candidatus Doudnabacteria bacterium RIFCSPHIGHO2_02_FULL_46_11]|uniref:Uncharacterized protein n=1 Tax=Candidatus Doudnabacteria bacterium RIFCSPHIGHO2_02_FULL_46_11 TaxID=1817832 RepID=A0A1F5P855_9BACT|nr:MAG: hypothetical protein A3J48_02620 [Candidatus Doudnabacteria bacterium RIFCSPHIGHO2_02_FULL_46_11]